MALCNSFAVQSALDLNGTSALITNPKLPDDQAQRIRYVHSPNVEVIKIPKLDADSRSIG